MLIEALCVWKKGSNARISLALHLVIAGKKDVLELHEKGSILRYGTGNLAACVMFEEALVGKVPELTLRCWRDRSFQCDCNLKWHQGILLLIVVDAIVYLNILWPTAIATEPSC